VWATWSNPRRRGSCSGESSAQRSGPAGRGIPRIERVGGAANPRGVDDGTGQGVRAPGHGTASEQRTRSSRVSERPRAAQHSTGQPAGEAAGRKTPKAGVRAPRSRAEPGTQATGYGRRSGERSPRTLKVDTTPRRVGPRRAGTGRRRGAIPGGTPDRRPDDQRTRRPAAARGSRPPTDGERTRQRERAPGNRSPTPATGTDTGRREQATTGGSGPSGPTTRRQLACQPPPRR